MKLKCYLVMKKLTSQPLGEMYPPSVLKHLQNCDQCRAEARAYTRMGTALRQTAGQEEECPTTWAKMRSVIRSYPREAPKPSRSLVPAFAMAGLLIVAVTTALLLHNPAKPPMNKPGYTIAAQPDHTQQNKDDSNIPTKTYQQENQGSTQVKDPAPLPKVRLEYTKRERPNTKGKQPDVKTPVPPVNDTPPVPEIVPNEEPTRMVNNVEPVEEPKVSTVPEEHVIEIVRTNDNIQRSDDSYAIRHVNSDCHYASYKL